MAELMELLSPDVVLVSDGALCALRPVEGAEKVLRFLMGIMSTRVGRTSTMEPRRLNGETARAARSPAGLEGVWFATVANGRITEILGVRNPEKLRSV